MWVQTPFFYGIVSCWFFLVAVWLGSLSSNIWNILLYSPRFYPRLPRVTSLLRTFLFPKHTALLWTLPSYPSLIGDRWPYKHESSIKVERVWTRYIFRLLWIATSFLKFRSFMCFLWYFHFFIFTHFFFHSSFNTCAVSRQTLLRIFKFLGCRVLHCSVKQTFMYTDVDFGRTLHSCMHTTTHLAKHWYIRHIHASRSKPTSAVPLSKANSDYSPMCLSC